jgi:hypothetical protein
LLVGTQHATGKCGLLLRYHAKGFGRSCGGRIDCGSQQNRQAPRNRLGGRGGNIESRLEFGHLNSGIGEHRCRRDSADQILSARMLF